jgi:hypothetical protein
MIQLTDGRRYGIIENIESCTYPEDRWLTHYSVNQNVYALVEFPPNKKPFHSIWIVSREKTSTIKENH